MAGLFREEALNAQGDRLLGEVTIARPLSLRLLGLFISAVFALLCVLLVFASYARKETVTGYVSPAHGIVRVTSGRPGVISALLVEEGDVVEAGTPLATIRSRPVSGNGLGINPEMIRVLERQLRELQHLEELAGDRNARQVQQLEARIDGLEAEAASLETRMAGQRRLVGITEANLDRLRRVAVDGYVSSEDLAAREEALLAAKQVSAALVQELAAVRSSARQAHAAVAQLPPDLEERLSELRSRRADLDLQRLQLTGQGAETIVAPVAGTVSAAAVVVGDSVESRQHLITLLPTGSELEAHLYVPTRAIGFVHRGQEVRILYDAFDYRRHGVQRGRVRQISSAVLPARETLERTRRNEPSYKVRVALPEQFFRGRNGEYALQPGMTLKADIMLETRTLASWLASPVLALRGRT